MGDIEFVPPAMGWVDDQVAVWAAVKALEDGGNGPATFKAAAPRLLAAGAAEDDPVFFWDAEEKVLGRRLSSWDQKSVGSCVSFGCGRAVQDLMLWEIAALGDEEWPGAEVATEPIYGGSRVEVGNRQIRGDGSVGAWAAKWVKDWGVLLRKVYGQYDLTSYSESRCRQWGDAGCPDVLEPEAKKHPVTAVAMVQTGDEVWAAIGGGKPVSIASNQGFTTRLVNGFCEPSGEWGHQMCVRGRFVHPTRGRCGVIQNSWGNYLPGDRVIDVLVGGAVKKVELPEGCFATTLAVLDRIARQKDSFAYAGFAGWKTTKLTWNPLA